jgi:hypothetical protein
VVGIVDHLNTEDAPPPAASRRKRR